MIAKPFRSYLTDGQRKCRPRDDGAHSNGWEPRSAPARARYRLTPKSRPTRAGRLKAATVAEHVEQFQAEEGHYVAEDDYD